MRALYVDTEKLRVCGRGWHVCKRKKILSRLFIGPPTTWQFSFSKLDKSASIFANQRCEKIERNYISRYIRSHT